MTGALLCFQCPQKEIAASCVATPAKAVVLATGIAQAVTAIRWCWCGSEHGRLSQGQVQFRFSVKMKDRRVNKAYGKKPYEGILYRLNGPLASAQSMSLS
jgi:hypothetical protein